MSEPLEELRTQLHRAEKIISNLESFHLPATSDQDEASLGQLRAGSRGLRDLDQSLELEIAKIAEHEQRRIARDLHDSLGSLLTAIDLRMSVVRRDVATEVLPPLESVDAIAELIHEAISRSRTLTRGLFPVGEDPEDLMHALGSLAERSGEHTPLKSRFECPQRIAIEDDRTANHLYRIAQEAANNAAKHSGGRSLVIRLEHLAAHLVLSIEDDGCGFQPNPDMPSKSLGLRIMQHRAQSIGGKLSILGSPSGGARVVCTLPDPTASSEPQKRGAKD